MCLIHHSQKLWKKMSQFWRELSRANVSERLTDVCSNNPCDSPITGIAPSGQFKTTENDGKDQQGRIRIEFRHVLESCPLLEFLSMASKISTQRVNSPTQVERILHWKQHLVFLVWSHQIETKLFCMIVHPNEVGPQECVFTVLCKTQLCSARTDKIAATGGKTRSLIMTSGFDCVFMRFSVCQWTSIQLRMGTTHRALTNVSSLNPVQPGHFSQQDHQFVTATSCERTFCCEQTQVDWDLGPLGVSPLLFSKKSLTIRSTNL